MQKLVDSLTPGETGCLMGGTFVEDVTVTRGGTDTARVTVTSGSTRATLRGRLWVTDSADYVTVSGLLLDGRNGPPPGLPSPTINGDHVHFLDNEVTNYNTTICFSVGSELNTSYGLAYDTVIHGNRIHNCGRRPPTNHHHGVYLVAARRAVVTNNWIYDNADRGVQMWPDADDSLVANNVIEGNGTGLILGGCCGYTSSGNVIRDNIIRDSLRYGIESSWEESPGAGNIAASNSFQNNRLGDVQPANQGRGFTID